MAARKVCPACGLSDRTDKVSTLYLLAIGGDRLAQDGQPIQPLANLGDLPAEEIRRIGRRFKPPASPRRAPTRPLHPDLVVITFSLIVPLFLYRIYQTQPSVLPVVLLLLALAYGLYFWQRRRVIARFQRQVQAGKAAEERIRAAIERWMGLYYCQRDDLVFEPGSPVTAPADDLLPFVMGSSTGGS